MEPFRYVFFFIRWSGFELYFCVTACDISIGRVGEAHLIRDRGVYTEAGYLEFFENSSFGKLVPSLLRFSQTRPLLPDERAPYPGETKLHQDLPDLSLLDPTLPDPSILSLFQWRRLNTRADPARDGEPGS